MGETTHMDFSNGKYWHCGMQCVDPAQGDWYGKTSWGKATFENITPQHAFEHVDEFCDEHGVVDREMLVSPRCLSVESSFDLDTAMCRPAQTGRERSPHGPGRMRGRTGHQNQDRRCSRVRQVRGREHMVRTRLLH